jgi:hypothetical protein
MRIREKGWLRERRRRMLGKGFSKIEKIKKE